MCTSTVLVSPIYSYPHILSRSCSLVNTCGVLISRIADMKMNDTTRYAIIDSGINHINYYGQAMAMKKPRCEFIPMEYTEGFADGADHEV